MIIKFVFAAADFDRQRGADAIARERARNFTTRARYSGDYRRLFPANLGSGRLLPPRRTTIRGSSPRKRCINFTFVVRVWVCRRYRGILLRACYD